MLRFIKIIKTNPMSKFFIKMSIFLFTILLFNTPSVSAQNWKLFKKNDALDCRYFVTDNLLNIYVVTSKNEILKYNQDGSFESRYANLKLGKLAQVDAMNPFKLMLYYSDFQTVQLVDNELNSLGSFNLQDLGVSRVGGVAMADDGKIWIYDAGTNKLMTLMGRNPAQVAQNSIVPFAGSTPVQMIFRNNTLYVNVPDKGIYTFDRLGKYQKLLNIKNVNYFQVVDNQLFYNQLGKMYSFQLQTFENNAYEATRRDSRY